MHAFLISTYDFTTFKSPTLNNCTQFLNGRNVQCGSMQISSLFAFGARCVRSREVVFKNAALSPLIRRVPAMNTPQCVKCIAVPAEQSTPDDRIAEGTTSSSKAVGALISNPDDRSTAIPQSLHESALIAVAAPAETARSPSAKTFYKRTLPCPPAVAFSSEEGTSSPAAQTFARAPGTASSRVCLE